MICQGFNATLSMQNDDGTWTRMADLTQWDGPYSDISFQYSGRLNDQWDVMGSIIPAPRAAARRHWVMENQPPFVSCEKFDLLPPPTD